MKKLSENFTFTDLYKMLNHGYFLYPLARKTILQDAKFSKGINGEPMVELTFCNSHSGNAAYFHTKPMTFKQVNDFLKQNVCSGSRELYRRIVADAVLCRKTISKSSIHRATDGIYKEDLVTFDIYKIQLPEGMYFFKYAGWREGTELEYSTGAMKWMNDCSTIKIKDNE